MQPLRIATCRFLVRASLKPSIFFFENCDCLKCLILLPLRLLLQLCQLILHSLKLTHSNHALTIVIRASLAAPRPIQRFLNLLPHLHNSFFLLQIPFPSIPELILSYSLLACNLLIKLFNNVDFLFFKVEHPGLQLLHFFITLFNHFLECPLIVGRSLLQIGCLLLQQNYCLLEHLLVVCQLTNHLFPLRCNVFI